MTRHAIRDSGHTRCLASNSTDVLAAAALDRHRRRSWLGRCERREKRDLFWATVGSSSTPSCEPPIGRAVSHPSSTASSFHSSSQCSLRSRSVCPLQRLVGEREDKRAAPTPAASLDSRVRRNEARTGRRRGQCTKATCAPNPRPFDRLLVVSVSALLSSPSPPPSIQI
jgi:hypothetical protein